jgi:hypothetical protein
MKCRNWVQIARTETGDTILVEYSFEGVVDEEWNNLTVNAEISKSLLPEWANWLWKEECLNFNLSQAQWKVIEKIVFNELKTLAERRLQQGTFKNGTTIQVRAPISLPLDIDSLLHSND